MLDRFTDLSRRVVALARKEARRLYHDCVGTEHLLLGLLQVKGGLASEVLQRFGVELESVSRELIAGSQPVTS